MVNGVSPNGASTALAPKAPLWVALDAMGGDLGPATNVAGALEAIRTHGVNVIVVGQKDVLEREIDRQGGRGLLGSKLQLVHAPHVAAMDDKPSVVIRRKDTSMRVAYDLVKAGQASAVVSAGNSGAYMGVALLVLGRIRGVIRPAIGTLLPSHTGQATLLMDSGANAAVAPEYLVQWAFMGDAYARTIMGRTRPAISVLSNGEEDSKGTDITRAANTQLKTVAPKLNYVGYCEGRDIVAATHDVVITDGFTGNVVLKCFEGVGKAVKDGVTARFTRSLWGRLQFLLVASAFSDMRRVLDYRLSGGAPLLGVSGVAVVAHGKSDAVALGHALRVAKLHVVSGLNEALAAAVAEHARLFPNAKVSARDFATARAHVEAAAEEPTSLPA